MKQKIKSLFLYISVFSLGIFVGLLLFFPTDVIRDVINRVGKGKFEVGDVSISFPLGVKIEDLVVKLLGSNGTDGVLDEDKLRDGNKVRDESEAWDNVGDGKWDKVEDGNKIWRVKSLRISPSLISPFTILLGTFSASGNLITYLGSDVDFSISLIKQKDIVLPRRIRSSGTLSFEDISLILGFPGVMVKGKSSLDIYLDGNLGEYQNLSGNIKIHSDGLTLILRNSPRLGLMAEGEFKFGRTDVELEIEKGVIRILSFRSQGGDIEGELAGGLILRKPFRETTVDLTANLKTKIESFPTGKLRITGTFNKPSISM